MGDRCEVLERQVAELQRVLDEIEPKAAYYDKVLQSRDLLPVTGIARDYGMSARAFNRMLHEMGVQYKKGDVWYLYAKYQGHGYMKGKTHNFPATAGGEHAREHSYWTQKGRMFLHEFLAKRGIMPLT